MSTRVSKTIWISQEMNTKLEALRKKNVQIVDIFKFGILNYGKNPKVFINTFVVPTLKTGKK